MFRFLFKWMLVLSLWGGLLIIGIVAWYGSELPDITQKATFERKTAITVKADNGDTIAQYGDIIGNAITTKDVPPHLLNAIMATEDRRFYNHFGIDLIGLARAMMVNAKEGRFVQGGSTLTQQLAKNLFLSRDRKIKRKIQEALLALWLEYELTKDEIFSAYLNRVYLGSGAYGVDAASKIYFSKPVADINLQEAATLAGLLKAPSRYSPLSNPKLSIQRTAIVLDAMVDAGYIKKEDIGKQNAPALLGENEIRDMRAERYFTDWIIDGVNDLIGTPNEDLIVETTLNANIQQHAENALINTLAKNGSEKNISQGAVLIMRPNGAVVGMVGGADYRKSQFNRAIQAKRQPGSSFKPIVYLTALQNGYAPDSIVLDALIEEGKYRPKNFGHKYYGELTMANALALSLNTVAFRLIQYVGPGSVAQTAKSLGIYSPLESNLSLALGTSEISMLEMTTAYSVIANGGHAVFPFAIEKISNVEGEVYYQRPAKRSTRQIIPRYQANTLTNMMRGVVDYGTGQRAKQGFPVAGKTGTSQESRDAWFIGFSDELVGAVWLGNDDNTPMKSVTGGSFPAGIWGEIMSKSRGQYPPVNDFDNIGEDIEKRKNTGFRFSDLLGRLGTSNNQQQNINNEDQYRRQQIESEKRFKIEEFENRSKRQHERQGNYNN